MRHHEFGPSSLDKRNLCPGSFNMEKGLPELPGNDIQLSGNRLHHAMETGDITLLEDNEVLLLEKAKETEEDRIIDLSDELGSPTVDEREIELITYNDELDELNFGTADRLLIFSKVGLVIDYKFGYNKVTKDSIQLLNYAIAAKQRYGLEKVICAVIQPAINNYPLITYTADDLEVGLLGIETIIRSAKDKYAPIVPGETQCRYCKAQMICPYIKKNMITLREKPNLPSFNDDELIEVFNNWKVISKVGKSIEYELNKRLDQSGQVGNLKRVFKPGNREVNNIAALSATIADYVTPEELLSVCKVGISPLEKLIVPRIQAVAVEKLTQKAAKEHFAELAGEFITRGKDKKSIVVV